MQCFPCVLLLSVCLFFLYRNMHPYVINYLFHFSELFLYRHTSMKLHHIHIHKRFSNHQESNHNLVFVNIMFAWTGNHSNCSLLLHFSLESLSDRTLSKQTVIITALLKIYISQIYKSKQIQLCYRQQKLFEFWRSPECILKMSYIHEVTVGNDPQMPFLR